MPSSPPGYSPSEQDYLKEIYLLQEGVGQATTQMLADRLGVKPPSVTAMIKRLAEEEHGALVRHEPYRGVELTERGVAVALEMLRHHRLIELLLSELLGVPWDRVHDEADRLEHALSEDLEELIAAKLGHPSYDPHGDPIPGRDGTVPLRTQRLLATLQSGDGGTVERVTAQEPGELQYLASVSIEPGAVVRVVEFPPHAGVMTVQVWPRNDGSLAGDVQGRMVTIGERLMHGILLGPAQEDDGRGPGRRVRRGDQAPEGE